MAKQTRLNNKPQNRAKTKKIEQTIFVVSSTLIFISFPNIILFSIFALLDFKCKTQIIINSSLVSFLLSFGQLSPEMKKIHQKSAKI